MAKRKKNCQNKFGKFLLGSDCSQRRTTNIRPLFVYHSWANCCVSMTQQAPILCDEPSPWVAPAEMCMEYPFGFRSHLYFLFFDVKTCFLISCSQINCRQLEESEAEGLVQWLKYFPRKHDPQNPHRSSRVAHACNLSIGELGQAEPWLSLFRQSSLLGKSRRGETYR